MLCLVDMAGVPLLLWKLLEEIDPGDRVLISRTPHQDRRRCSRIATGSWPLLAGAFVSEGWVGASRAGFNNVDKEFFDRVVGCLSTRSSAARATCIRAGSRQGSVLHELDVQNLERWRRSPLAELLREGREKSPSPEFVWRADRGL